MINRYKRMKIGMKVDPQTPRLSDYQPNLTPKSEILRNKDAGLAGLRRFGDA
jgi:hypothetical protein